ncbi:putative urea ABC transporter substrate-binding protein [Marinobacter psychrophilus]|jgi:NitT/TauT family transport system substrate-binding protein|uniref:putative urea ABC transporter substrate-binding protein n=1 Tax=Marinobacter psychrophilus TaxID=330734 RepID=UPI001B66EDF9|nr:putative urea ABC transporter substrate-binding protein [Marinobacter psychrophilus]MBQ0762431.1 putative urea ABC transporter substrate-binding protein [Marinobacter psychrophilus]MBQ0844715.1 putative urea ABC transporter substrate-binding protein [Marinobacter psychrophilus]
MKKRNFSKRVAAGLLTAGLSMGALAQEKDSFSIAWTIYAGWVPWQYAEDSGIMKKWADKYNIDVDIVQINDYIESLNQFTAGQFDGVVATSMDGLSIPAASGVDTTALIVGDYSNGNDGLVSKDAKTIAELEGETVHLVELSVSHYLLARALNTVGLEERDISVVNISDADLLSAFQTDDVRHVATWNPLLAEVEAFPGTTKLFDSSAIPGHIKDLTLVNTETLADNPKLGKALVGAWYETMSILASDSEEGQEARAMLGELSGTDQVGYEAQLAGMKMFWVPQMSVDFINSKEAHEAMDSVRQFSFEKGLLGQGAMSPDFVGIEFPDGSVMGDEGNVKLRFDDSYMQMAADGEL